MNDVRNTRLSRDNSRLVMKKKCQPLHLTATYNLSQHIFSLKLAKKIALDIVSPLTNFVDVCVTWTENATEKKSLHLQNRNTVIQLHKVHLLYRNKIRKHTHSNDNLSYTMKILCAKSVTIYRCIFPRAIIFSLVYVNSNSLIQIFFFHLLWSAVLLRFSIGVLHLYSLIVYV